MILLQNRKHRTRAGAVKWRCRARTIERHRRTVPGRSPARRCRATGGGYSLNRAISWTRRCSPAWSWLLWWPELWAGQRFPAPLARSPAESWAVQARRPAHRPLLPLPGEPDTRRAFRTAIASMPVCASPITSCQRRSGKCAEPYRIVFQWGRPVHVRLVSGARQAGACTSFNRLTLSVTAQTFATPRHTARSAGFQRALPRRHTAARPRRGQRMLPPRGGVRPGCYTRQPDGSCCWRSATPTKTSRQPRLLGFSVEVLELPGAGSAHGVRVRRSVRGGGGAL